MGLIASTSQGCFENKYLIRGVILITFLSSMSTSDITYQLQHTFTQSVGQSQNLSQGIAVGSYTN